MEFSGRGILLDIEGTTSSVDFVYEVMFPFARRELVRFLGEHWPDESVQSACDQIAADAGHASLATWCPDERPATRQAVIRDEVIRLMDQDIKATGLKSLQGLIWRAGFESGELVSHVYDDVIPALQRWQQSGFDLRIYSSGSVMAQHLFFGHTQKGNLLPYFSAHYDTRVGSKKHAASYEAIADDFGWPPGQLLFLSDVVAELDAAEAAGFLTGLCVRPENAATAEAHQHPVISGFDEIQATCLSAS